MLKRMFGLDPLSKVIKEFKTIKELQAKNQAFKSKIEEQEDAAEVDTYKDIIAAQTEMLNNNFRSLAHVFEVENSNTKVNPNNPSSLFNFRSTSPKIHHIKEANYIRFESFTHNTGEVITNKNLVVTEDLYTYASTINFELGFKRVLDNIKNKKAKNKIQEQMSKKIRKKVNLYCDSLEENAHAARKYIFSNLDDHFFSDGEYSLVKLPELINRFNTMINFDVEVKSDSKGIIGAKNILTINNDKFSNNLLDFLIEHSNPNHDYIVLNNHFSID